MANRATSSPIHAMGLRQLAMIVIVVWGLVAMPVNYTGGAARTHPHSFLQFLREAETGTMSHHRLPNAEPMPDHVAPKHMSEPMPGDEAVENAPIVSPPTFGIERLLLNSVVQPALAGSIFVLFAAIWFAAIRLTGRAISPLIPPPRIGYRRFAHVWEGLVPSSSLVTRIVPM